MCDLENSQCPAVLASSDDYSKTDMLNNPVIEDEKIKDNAANSVQNSVRKECIEKMAEGMLSLYVDDLKKSSASLNELLRNQGIVIETIEQETTRINEATSVYKLEEMISKIKEYHIKAQTVKKEMMSIHERTSKLKKRAMKLQQQKQKEALHKELQREREIERDRQLAPKIVTKTSSEK